MRIRTLTFLGLFVLLALALPASAHPGHPNSSATAGTGADVAAGLAHPFTGVDHLLAMLAVGLLAAKLAGRCLWALPSLFVAGMVGGGAAAMGAGQGATIGGVEQGIAASVVVLGLMLVFVGRLPRGLALAAVPAFALFHGYAHLAEGGGHEAVGYGAGMLLGSALLHAGGLGVGLAVGRRRSAEWAWRVGGGAVTAAGLALLAGTL
jgi:urease accessory protein